MSEKKTRVDNRLGMLPEERQLEIAEHARTHTLAETVEWLRQDGMRVGKSALSRYLAARREREAQERILRSIASGADLVRATEKKYAKNPAPTNEQLIKVFRVLVMQLAATGACDAEFLKIAGPLMGTVLEAERLELKRSEVGLTERRVVLLERRAAQAEAAERVAGDGTLSDEEKQARMREIFGIGQPAKDAKDAK